MVDGSCLTITDVADNIDELVNDVMNLESLFSSQAALIQRLEKRLMISRHRLKPLKRIITHLKVMLT